MPTASTYAGCISLIVTASMSGWMTRNSASDSNRVSMEKDESRYDSSACSNDTAINTQLCSIDESLFNETPSPDVWTAISGRPVDMQVILDWLEYVPQCAWATILPVFACFDIFLAGCMLRCFCRRARGHKISTGKADAKPGEHEPATEKVFAISGNQTTRPKRVHWAAETIPGGPMRKQKQVYFEPQQNPSLGKTLDEAAQAAEMPWLQAYAEDVTSNDSAILVDAASSTETALATGTVVDGIQIPSIAADTSKSSVQGKKNLGDLELVHHRVEQDGQSLEACGKEQTSAGDYSFEDMQSSKNLPRTATMLELSDSVTGKDDEGPNATKKWHWFRKMSSFTRHAA